MNVSGRREKITAIPVVPNLGHPMVGRKDIACLLVSIKSRNELLRFANDIVDNADIIHVFLLWCEKNDKHDRQCGHTIPSSGVYMSVR